MSKIFKFCGLLRIPTYSVFHSEFASPNAAGIHFGGFKRVFPTVLDFSIADILAFLLSRKVLHFASWTNISTDGHLSVSDSGSVLK